MGDESQVEFATWNTLHDGVIESINGVVPGDLTITISISYLCRKLPTAADSLLLLLRHCTRFYFVPFEGGEITDTTAIGSLGVEVLSAEEQDGIVRIACVTGTLFLVYAGIDIKLAEGAMVSQSQLENAAEEYWAAWTENAKKNNPPN